MSRKRDIKKKIRIIKSGDYFILVYCPKKGGSHIHPLNEKGEITEWGNAARFTDFKDAKEAKNNIRENS